MEGVGKLKGIEGIAEGTGLMYFYSFSSDVYSDLSLIFFLLTQLLANGS